MLHSNNLKEPGISTITTATTGAGGGTGGIGGLGAVAIEQNAKADNSIVEGNKGIMSLTRRPTLEQQFNLMGKQRAKNDEHVLATTNNNYSSGSSINSSSKRSKSANSKIQKSPKLFNEFNDVNKEQQQQQQQQERITEEQQKLHNNQPLIANIEHLSCQTHALAHTSSNTRPNLAAYSQPYTMHQHQHQHQHQHTTNTLSTFKGKNCTNNGSSSSSSALSRNSHYFSSLDNRSQRYQEHKQQHQQQQQQHYIQNYPHYRQKKRKQNYDSLLPYSVANLPTLQKTNATYCSSDGSSSEEDTETLTTTLTATALPRTPINKSGTTHYHMSHHKMHQQQQQQQLHTKQSTKDNQGHYISPIQAKSSLQQQQIEITSLKQNKRHKLQHRHLPNSQQEHT